MTLLPQNQKYTTIRLTLQRQNVYACFCWSTAYSEVDLQDLIKHSLLWPEDTPSFQISITHSPTVNPYLINWV